MKILFITAFLTLLGVCSSQRCFGGQLLKSGLSADLQQKILHLHNTLRDKVAGGIIAAQPMAENMKEMVWDDEMAIRAQNWANNCVFQHEHPRLNKKGQRYGQNLAHVNKVWSSDDGEWEVLSKMITEWFDEIYEPNDSLHFSQMVWANTHQIGCGYSEYTNDGNKGRIISIFVCNYFPSGNIIGSQPYSQGTKSCEKHGLTASRTFRNLCAASEGGSAQTDASVQHHKTSARGAFQFPIPGYQASSSWQTVPSYQVRSYPNYRISRYQAPKYQVMEYQYPMRLNPRYIMPNSYQTRINKISGYNRQSYPFPRNQIVGYQIQVIQKPGYQVSRFEMPNYQRWSSQNLISSLKGNTLLNSQLTSYQTQANGIPRYNVGNYQILMNQMVGHPTNQVTIQNRRIRYITEPQQSWNSIHYPFRYVSTTPGIKGTSYSLQGGFHQPNTVPGSPLLEYKGMLPRVRTYTKSPMYQGWYPTSSVGSSWEYQPLTSKGRLEGATNNMLRLIKPQTSIWYRSAQNKPVNVNLQWFSSGQSLNPGYAYQPSYTLSGSQASYSSWLGSNGGFTGLPTTAWEGTLDPDLVAQYTTPRYEPVRSLGDNANTPQNIGKR